MVAFPTIGQDPWGATLNTALVEMTPSPVATDRGWIAWSYPPSGANNGTALTSGTMVLVRVQVRSAATITNVIAGVTSVGVTLTVGQNFAALYNSSGTRVGVTADQATNWQSTGPKIMPLTASFAAPAGFYWVALLSNGATPPSIARASAQNSLLSNAGTTAATSFFATNGVGATTTPASITPASNVQIATEFFAAVS